MRDSVPSFPSEQASQHYTRPVAAVAKLILVWYASEEQQTYSAAVAAYSLLAEYSRSSASYATRIHLSSEQVGLPSRLSGSPGLVAVQAQAFRSSSGSHGKKSQTLGETQGA